LCVIISETGKTRTGSQQTEGVLRKSKQECKLSSDQYCCDL